MLNIIIVLSLFTVLYIVISKIIGPYNFLYCILAFLAFTDSYIIINIPFFPSTRIVLAIILLVVWFKKIDDVIKSMHALKIFVPYVMLTAYLIFSSLLISGSPKYSDTYEILGDSLFVLLTASFIMRSNRKDIKIVFFVVAFSLFINTLFYSDTYFSFLEYFNFPEGHGTTHQLSGLSAMYALPLFLLLSSYSNKKYGMSLSSIFVYMSLIGIFVSGARAPFIGSAIIYLLWKHKQKRFLIVIPILIILYVILPQESTYYASNRMNRLIDAIQVGNPEELGEIEFRLKNIELAIEMFDDNPVFGIGYANWHQSRQEYTFLTVDRLASHNSYASALAELGLVGCIIVLWFFYSVLKNSITNPFLGFSNALSFTGFSGIIGIFIVSITHNILLSRITFFYIGILIGAKAVRARKLSIGI